MKYKIWNKADTLYTPVGEAFSPEEYIIKYAGWANIPGVRCVIADAPINCSVFSEFEAFKQHYAHIGVEFTEDMSDQECLDAISTFEDSPPEYTPSAEERIAAALEFQNLLSM